MDGHEDTDGVAIRAGQYHLKDIRHQPGLEHWHVERVVGHDRAERSVETAPQKQRDRGEVIQGSAWLEKTLEVEQRQPAQVEYPDEAEASQVRRVPQPEHGHPFPPTSTGAAAVTIGCAVGPSAALGMGAGGRGARRAGNASAQQIVTAAWALVLHAACPASIRMGLGASAHGAARPGNSPRRRRAAAS
eukprot:SAG31_NODE_2228_length_6146_cov_4.401191_2_plen_189_part_00